MHPLASYLTAVHATPDRDLADDDLRAWNRQQATAVSDEQPARRHRRIVSMLQVRFALLARRSPRSAGRSA